MQTEKDTTFIREDGLSQQKEFLKEEKKETKARMGKWARVILWTRILTKSKWLLDVSSQQHFSRNFTQGASIADQVCQIQSLAESSRGQAVGKQGFPGVLNGSKWPKEELRKGRRGSYDAFGETACCEYRYILAVNCFLTIFRIFPWLT